ncbi:MAG: hypothetical protein R3D63_09645 [Paracoccaceae bacterium]
MRQTRLAALVSCVAFWGATASLAAPPLNDYPTEARAEYVFGCMAANGQTQDALRRCSCSIDEIASVLTYEDYVAAETVLQMRQTGGEAGALFRGSSEMRTILGDLRRAQAEAEVLCF